MQPGVLGFVNHAHPPAAELFNDAVVRDGLADHRRTLGCNLRGTKGASQQPWVVGNNSRWEDPCPPSKRICRSAFSRASGVKERAPASVSSNLAQSTKLPTCAAPYF